MSRYRVQPIWHLGTGAETFGILDREPDQNTARPGKVLALRTAIRDYTETEAACVADWLNGCDRPILNMRERFADPNDPMRAWPNNLTPPRFDGSVN